MKKAKKSKVQSTPFWDRGLFIRFGVLLVSAIALVHIVAVDRVPDGLLASESYLGLQAISILQDGLKASIDSVSYFSLSTTFLFAVLEPTIGVLRLTGVLWFFGFLAVLCYLLRDRYREIHSVRLYGLLAAGLLPWFFTLSRIAIDSNVHLLLVACMLLCGHRTLVAKNSLPWALALGCFAGLYAEHSFIEALLILTLFLVVFGKRRPQEIAASGGIMFVLYFFSGPIVELPTISFGGIIAHYFSHFSLWFLLFFGDADLTVSTGFGGSLSLVVFVMAVVGLCSIVRNWKLADAWEKFLVVFLLLSPIAPSLVIPATVLWSTTFALAILLLSCEGVASLFRNENELFRGALFALVFVGLLFQGGVYMHDYFTRYRDISRLAFKTSGIFSATALAVDLQPAAISVSEYWEEPHVLFARRLVPNPKGIPLYHQTRHAERGWCYVFPLEEKQRMNRVKLPFQEWLFGDGITILRCYGPLNKEL